MKNESNWIFYPKMLFIMVVTLLLVAFYPKMLFIMVVTLLLVAFYYVDENQL